MFNRPANRSDQGEHLGKQTAAQQTGGIFFFFFNISPNFGVKDLDVRLLVPSRKNSTGANPF